MYYSSRDKNCKSVFGALKTEEKCKFTVYAAEFDECFLIMHADGGERIYSRMPKTDWERFQIELTFDKVGLYFYSFLLKKGSYEQYFWRQPDQSAGSLYKREWQITVYDKSFTAPKGYGSGVMYQIFPDRFYMGGEFKQGFEERFHANWGDTPSFAMTDNPRAGGKVINNDYFGGDLIGIEKKLPYLNELGVSEIYLNPIFEAHSNHRYNTANYLKIDPTLGTEKDFISLCKSAHKLGMKIILDGVFSHTGSDSIYFNKEKRYEGGAYNDKNSPYYSWFNFNKWPGDYQSWWGFDTLPETIETDESFAEFITGEDGVINYWMNLGADGFRLDVADELPDSFIEKIRTAVKRANKNGILYGEVWEDASNKEAYFVRRKYLLGSELDSVMNYPFKEAILGFVKGYMGGTDFINAVMTILENYPKPSVDVLMNLLGTHDTPRILTELVGEDAGNRGREWQAAQHLRDWQYDKGFKMLKLATVLQYTLPGIPCVYYGDELLTEGYRDPFNRTCFDWDKLTDGCSSVDWYARLGEIRKSCPALDGGTFLPVQSEKDFMTFLRIKDGHELFVAVNPSDRDKQVWLLPGWQNDEVLIGIPPERGVLQLPAKTAAILKRVPRERG